jgi:hypothetical protein
MDCVVDEPNAAEELTARLATNTEYILALYCCSACVVGDWVVYASREGRLAKTS